jgi:hypothetical protein
MADYLGTEPPPDWLGYRNPLVIFDPSLTVEKAKEYIAKSYASLPRYNVIQFNWKCKQCGRDNAEELKEEVGKSFGEPLITCKACGWQAVLTGLADPG